MTARTGKIALVIGGTRGIGAAVSRRMVADGAAPALLDRSRLDEAQRFIIDILVSIAGLTVTAYAAKGDEERIHQAGAEPYIPKPVTVLRFMEAVCSLTD